MAARRQPPISGRSERGPSELVTAPPTRPAGPVQRARPTETVVAIAGPRKPLLSSENNGPGKGLRGRKSCFQKLTTAAVAKRSTADLAAPLPQRGTSSQPCSRLHSSRVRSLAKGEHAALAHNERGWLRDIAALGAATDVSGGGVVTIDRLAQGFD